MDRQVSSSIEAELCAMTGALRAIAGAFSHDVDFEFGFDRAPNGNLRPSSKHQFSNAVVE